MAKKSAYATTQDAKFVSMIAKNCKNLPSFAGGYLKSRLLTSSARTVLQYSYSLGIFFRWFQQAVPHLADKEIKDISIEEFQKVTARDIEEFMLYLQSNPDSPNSRASIAQKIAALGAMTNYLHRHDEIPSDPCAKVDRPKVIKDKRIIYLTDDECIRLLDAIEYGIPGTPSHQEAYLARTRCRDLTIITLLLNTGIRLDECVGLDITDINLNEKKMQVYRKGGKFQYIPLNSEVIEILTQYISERKQILAADKVNEKALFLSIQRKRIGGGTIENMLRKYAIMAGITKPITPHKLRKTYGTSLYRKTRDIYITANALGHENVATTSRHYVDDTVESLQSIAEDIYPKCRKTH